MRRQAKGSTRLAAPTSTAVAPASISSMTSSALITPPRPTMGMRTASYTCQTMRTASGKSAGPDMPPVLLARSGFLALRSRRMPITVLMRLMPSAPASSQALAMSAMLVTLGESLTMTGFLTASLTARVTDAAALGSVPKLMPPPWTLGHEMFTSSQPTCGQASSFWQTSTYSSSEKPLTFAMTGLWKTRASLGSSSAMTASTPGF